MTAPTKVSPEQFILNAIRKAQSAEGKGVIPTFGNKELGDFSLNDLFVAYFDDKHDLRTVAEAMEAQDVLTISGRKAKNGRKYVVYHVSAELKKIQAARKVKMNGALAAITAGL